MFSEKIDTDKAYHRKAHKILLKRSIFSVYLNFFWVGHFFHEILQGYFTFLLLALVLQFIQAVRWYNL